MPFAVEDRPIRPLTAQEVLRMVEHGILDDDEPVELLGGVLREVSPKSPAHEAVKSRLLAWLASGVAASRYLVRVEAPLVVPDRTSLPEPDVAVVEPRDYTVRHPASALLVIEVAVTSPRTDTEVKPALYAAAGVPEYWVVDVPERRLFVFEAPSAEGYRQERVLRSGRTAPRSIEAEPLELAELLAGL